MKYLFILAILFIIGCATEPVDKPMPKENNDMIEIIQIGDDSVEGSRNEPGITLAELANHNTEDDCWIVYDGMVYDYTSAPRHPQMDKTFFSHCGQATGFQEGARDQHSASNEGRVANFGNLIGELI